MSDLIDRVIAWIDNRERMALAPQIERLEREMANINQITADRLAAYDAEAKLQRDHFRARIEIDNIRTRRELAQKSYRMSLLTRSVME